MNQHLKHILLSGIGTVLALSTSPFLTKLGSFLISLVPLGS